MSKRVFIICEGPTDDIFLRPILASIDPTLVVTRLQPEVDGINGHAGPHGGGWKGVRSWCQTIAAQGGITRTTLNSAHAIILHVDADIASDWEVGCAQPCPPASATVDALQALICAQWLGQTQTTRPSALVFCIPAQSTELWMWAALYPDELCTQANPACMPEPASKLTHRAAKYVQRKDGKYRKNPSAYRAAGAAIAAGWPAVTERIPEALAFHTDLCRALSNAQTPRP